MLKIDSGERVIKLDPARISKITQAWRADNLADIYEEGQDTPSQSLTIEESLAFLPKTYDPERCHFRGNNLCYWRRDQRNAPARCIRCRLSQLYFEKTGKDIRPVEEETPFPTVPFCVLLGGFFFTLSLVGALSVSRLSDQRETLTIRIAELKTEKEVKR